MHRNKRFNLITILLFSIASLTLLLLSFIVAPIDAVVHINGWSSSSLDFLFAGITNLGDGIVLVIFVVLLLFYRFYTSIALITNGIIQGLIVSLFKRVLFPDALRPLSFLDPAMIHPVDGVNVHRYMTFPSGHTVSVFGLCIFLALCTCNRGVTIVLLTIAILVALSRVYLLQHFLMDVAVGSLMGSLIGGGTYYFFELRDKPQWMQQRLEWKRKRATSPDSISQ